MNNNIMVDTETLGVYADSVIMSIGAVRFNLETGEIQDPFYVSISVDSNLAQGRKINEDTLIWWMKQPPEAQEVFHEPKVTLTEALEQFLDWFGEGSNTKVWSNGADFDIPLLAHAFRANNFDTPWEFRNTRCYRTAKNSAKGINTPKPAINTLQHHALQDAIFQATHLTAIFGAANTPLMGQAA
jgi:hypothetical protein